MAFNANIKRPAQYSNNGPRNNNATQNSFDRLVTVKGYDVSRNVMMVEDDKAKNYEVFVNPAEVVRSNKSLETNGKNSASYTWMGHSIDSKMEKANPPGSKVILQKSKVVSVDKIANVSKTEVHRIVSVPQPELDKTFQGIFTLTYRMDDGQERVSRIQHWNPNGIDVNNEEGIQALKAKIDEARKNHGAKVGEYNVTEPTIGFQFRALMKTDRIYNFAADKTKSEIYEVVDTSLPFDWIPGDQDEQGNEIKSLAHPVTGDELEAFIDGYVGYVSEQFADHLENMKVEVAYYHVYPASKNDYLRLTTGNPDLDRNADKNPLYQLTHRKSFVDMAQTESIQGKNAAVNGIIQIGKNKIAKVDGVLREIPSYWATRLHANNTRGHVHAFIRTEDGYKTEPHDNLKIIKDESMTNSQNQPTSYQTASTRQEEVHHEEMTATANTHVPAATQVESTFDPFASDLGDTEPAAPVATETKPVTKLRFGAK